MKKIISLLIYIFLFSKMNAQVMHSLLFINEEEQGREADRKAEMQQMKDFCISISEILKYKHNLHCHSGAEFTSDMIEFEISSLDVKENDIVILYYHGHGCNWDDDDWPHMCFLDKQYWESEAYKKLKSVTSKAKLTLCIASCCNMDSEGRKRMKESFANLDELKAEKLFLGFEGKKIIITSSSIKGQFSYSWTSGTRMGSIYSISLRKTINDALSGNSNVPLNWHDILEATNNLTLSYTDNKQLPQYKIENNVTEIPVSPKPSAKTNLPSAEIENVWTTYNTDKNNRKYLEIHSDFKTHFMNNEGGRIVAFFYKDINIPLKDTNNSYCSSDGQVSVGLDIGSHYEHASFKDINLTIPLDEIPNVSFINDLYLRLGIYDYRLQKYIYIGEYAKLCNL